MNNIWQRILTKIPEEYKDEFERQIIKDNYSRIEFLSIILFCIESIIYFVIGTFFNSGEVVLAFIISNTVLIPIILLVNNKINTINIYLAKAVQYIYAIAVLLLGIFLALVTQGEADFVHMYLMTVFGVTLIINMMPLESGILLMAAYLGFSFLLPYYQDNNNMIFVIRENTLIFNLFAWLQSRMVLRIRLSLFLDRKLIEEKNLKLEELTKRDSMTGLLNHVTSFDLLKEEINRAKNSGHPLSLIIADIDDFKEINDNCGHLAGDHVIIKIAEVIINNVIPTHIVGRYGGEEFIIIMPDTNLEKAQLAAEKIQSGINSVKYDDNMTITLSGGISQFSGETIEEFIRKTDKKLYKAKHCGKNRFQV